MSGKSGRIDMGEKLTAGDVAEMKQRMKEAIETGVRELVLGCEKLEQIDSSGIGCLVAAHNSLSKVEGSLKLEGVSGEIYELLSAMRLERRMKIEKRQE